MNGNLGLKNLKAVLDVSTDWINIGGNENEIQKKFSERVHQRALYCKD